VRKETIMILRIDKLAIELPMPDMATTSGF
jgi:hypothetical protein